MLVRRRSGRLELITQPDHAALAGVLAEHWGNERFAVPAPRPALICAARHHDDGWHELDDLLAFNESEQRPAHFTELPLTATAGAYGRGVESVYARDLRAGALVSMHWSGFYTSRWGVGGGAASTNPLALEIVAAQEMRWMSALREVWDNRGRRSEFDAATWHAYEVLQAVDLLSLALALMDVDAVDDARDPAAVESTLTRLDQPPGPRTINTVPLAAGAPLAAVRLRPLGEGRVRLEPSPLHEAELEVSLPVRHLEDRRYATAAQASAAYTAAEPQIRRVTLVAG